MASPGLPTLLQLGVVLPVFNRAVTVRSTLDAVAGQTLAPAMCVVVDDGSTDGSADAVEQWIRERQPRFPCKVLRQENRGASAARNVGLQACGDVDLVAYLDSDDIWPPDFLARAAAALSADPSAVAATADRQYQSRHGSKPVRSGEGLASDAARWMLEHDAGIASATVCRAAVARACGGFPEDMRTGADIAIFMRVAMRGRWLHLPGLPVTYRWHDIRPAGEAGHLSETYVDRGRIWAGILQGLLAEFGDRSDFPRELCIDVIGRQAWLASLELGRAGRAAEGTAVLDAAAALRFPAPVRVSVVVTGDSDSGADQYAGAVGRLVAQAEALRERHETHHGMLRHLVYPIELVVVGHHARMNFGASGDSLTVRVVPAAGLDYFGMKNHGVAAATGDYVVLIDSDAVPGDRWLERLLGSFDNPRTRVVAGHASPRPDSAYGAALAAAGPMPVEVEGLDAPLTVASEMFAGNVAAARPILLAHPFEPDTGESRERCVPLVRRLGAHGCSPYMNPRARVTFPPPPDLGQFVRRAVALAHDERRAWGGGMLSALRRGATGLGRACGRLVRYRQPLGLRWWAMPAAITVLLAHYSVYTAAGIARLIAHSGSVTPRNSA
jgi:glycosyltransferase involved in cell wall biosynthesis